MKIGFLSQYFDGVAAKILSAVEANIIVSHQHEFNGVEGLRKILGEPHGKVTYEAQFMYFTDYDDEPLVEDGFLTWYDARQKAREERNVQRYEYRLYFSDNTVTQSANAGDILIISKKKDGKLLLIITEKETTIASQLLWLFGFSDIEHPGFSVREELETDQDRIEFASRVILENIGVEVEISEDNYLDDMLKKFNGNFPSTKIFSEYARTTIKDINTYNNNDSVLMACYEKEEILFRTLEKHFISNRLKLGFNEVDEFIAFSLSVQNRRKSRAGYALENHLEYIFLKNKIRFDRTPITENKARPDFLFPGIKEYNDKKYIEEKLAMLGVKSTCKDRWRQVLSEADRINEKHVFTLESAISFNQTEEMRNRMVQLVIPEKLHNTYTDVQQKWIMNLEEFVTVIKEKQYNS